MKRIVHVIGLVLAVVLCSTGAQGAGRTYPDRTIRFVVGYPPGGATDTLARILAQKMGQRFGHAVIVQNKPGANSIIAADYVAKARPNGYRILIDGPGLMTLTPGVYKQLPYNPEKDFFPITLLASDPLVIAVNPSLKVHTLKALIALAKSEPGKLSYAEGAPPMHVGAEMFKKAAGVNIVHIPYKGSSASIRAAVSGEVPIVVVSVGPVLSQLRAGKLLALAVTAKHRAAHLPNVPTVSEAAGLDFEGGVWLGMFAPAETPHRIIDKLYGEVSQVLKSASVRKRLEALGYDATGSGMTPVQFGTYFRTKVEQWTQETRELHLGAR